MERETTNILCSVPCLRSMPLEQSLGGSLFVIKSASSRQPLNSTQHHPLARLPYPRFHLSTMTWVKFFARLRTASSQPLWLCNRPPSRHLSPQGRLYSLSGLEREALETYINHSLVAGIIQPSSSPAGSGFFFVEKKDKTLRPCIEYRGLNDITVKNRYPFPLWPLLHLWLDSG